MTINSKTDSERQEHEITLAIARIKAGILAIVIGLIAGFGLFAMTAILIIEQGPNTGLHLQLLGNYFYGYSVTWKGAIIGCIWGFLTGGSIGLIIGLLYNRIVGIRVK